MTDTRTVLAELDSKLTKSAAALDVYARAETRAYERPRLLGKAEGLRLARSYIQDRIRTQPAEITTDVHVGQVAALEVLAPIRDVIAQWDSEDMLPAHVVIEALAPLVYSTEELNRE